MKRPERPQSKAKKLEGTHKLLQATAIKFWRHKRSLLKIAVVYVVINSLLQLILSAEVSALYQGIWFVIFSTTIIWFVRIINNKSGAKPLKLSLATAYYDGSAPVLRFFLVLLVLLAITAPFSLGLFIYLAVNKLALGALAPRLIAGLVLTLLSVLSLYCIVRLIFALLVVTLPAIKPIGSLRISWKLTRGSSADIAIRLIIYVIYSSLIMVPFLLLVSALSLNATLALLIISVVANGVLIPFGYFYLYELYSRLS